MDSLKIDPWDRACQFGDGLFETIAVFQGRPCLWSEHRQRIAKGLKQLRFVFVDLDQIEKKAWSLAKQLGQARLKLIISRGSSQSGYRVPDPIQPKIIWQSFPWHKKQYAAIKLGLCRHRLSLNPALAGIKHLNRLDQVLARMEWQDEYFESLMLDLDGWVIEGTMSNLYIERHHQIYTPKLDRCGIAGVVRQAIIQKAQQMGQPVIETRLSLDQIKKADRIYLSNSMIGIVNVAEFLNRSYDQSRHPILEQVNPWQ